MKTPLLGLLFTRFVGGVALAAAVAGCFLFLPESHDRIELATAQSRDTCKNTEIDPQIVGPSVIDRVEPLYATVPSRSGHDVHFLGAKIRIRPTPGMTPDLLERVLRCHSAQQTLGTATVATSNSPYYLPTGWVKIKVDSEDGAFAAKVSSHDRPTAEEILKRARTFIITPAIIIHDGGGGGGGDGDERQPR